MAHDEAYYEAEKKIEEARKLKQNTLVLSSAESDKKLSEIPESLIQLTHLRSLSIYDCPFAENFLKS
jgi:hypothetical protein